MMYQPYSSWVKESFYRTPKGLNYDQLLKAKDFYSCDRICFYFADFKTPLEAVKDFIEVENNYDGIIKHNKYTKVVYYRVPNCSRIYIYLGK